MIIRPEQTHDHQDVFNINAAAFDTNAEARLVEALRKDAYPIISLVAEVDHQVVGHIMFSPVMLNGRTDPQMIGLAPMSVATHLQRSGIGSALVREGLKRSKTHGFVAAVVLGHPTYYPRFGFKPSSAYNLKSEYDVPEDVFMILELQPGVLQAESGAVQYHKAFSNL